MNELVIGRRTHVYIALYRYVAEIDTVFVLAIRNQREAGICRGDGTGLAYTMANTDMISQEKNH